MQVAESSVTIPHVKHVVDACTTNQVSAAGRLEAYFVRSLLCLCTEEIRSLYYQAPG